MDQALYVIPDCDGQLVYELAIKNKRLLRYLNGQYRCTAVDFLVPAENIEEFKRDVLNYYGRHNVKIKAILTSVEFFK